MDVLIIEMETGKLIAKLPIILRGMNYTPQEEEYFSAAWECAVEDKIVESNRRDKYSFQLVRPT